jgi:hypothetical protein
VAPEGRAAGALGGENFETSALAMDFVHGFRQIHIQAVVLLPPRLRIQVLNAEED